ncbi:MAG: S4 domain-containing protein YaaA [Lutispora sp.]|uniref:S4 domain-containing protein YaaA n=1 Tax=Lutispora sp. TaxID=2828727 RepID=UPI003562B2B5
MLEIKIDTEFIKLDQFLKFTGLVNTGGEAKNIIMEGRVMVNGEVERARGKKLRVDDIVELGGRKYKIV